MITGKEVLDSRWEVLRGIGKGAFSEIYAAKDLQFSTRGGKAAHPFVAIKVQHQSFEKSVVRWEATVMNAVCRTNRFPKVISTGYLRSTSDIDYVVMELLSGDDMATIRNRIRSKSPYGLVPVAVASYFARQMLLALRDMHSFGFIHRDVKPSNFMRRDNTSTTFCIIDFGLAKQYKDSSGRVKDAKGSAEFRGTTVYASPYVHEGHDQCPRDDLCSVFHVFLDMTCGKLPWGDMARAKEKENAAKMKRALYDDPQSFLTALSNDARAIELKSGWQGSSNFSRHSKDIVLQILHYLKSLQYGMEPNYDHLDTLFAACDPELESHGNIGDVMFAMPGFAWRDHHCTDNLITRLAAVGSSSSSSSAPPPGLPQQVDSSGNKHTTCTQSHPPTLTIQQQAALPPLPPQPTQPAIALVTAPEGDQIISKIKQLAGIYDKLKRESQTTGTSTRDPKAILNTAMRWKNISNVLFNLPEDRVKVEKDLLDAALEVLRLNKHFYGMHVDESEGNEEGWAQFIEVQEIVGRFYELYSKVHNHNHNRPIIPIVSKLSASSSQAAHQQEDELMAKAAILAEPYPQLETTVEEEDEDVVVFKRRKT